MVAGPFFPVAFSFWAMSSILTRSVIDTMNILPEWYDSYTIAFCYCLQSLCLHALDVQPEMHCDIRVFSSAQTMNGSRCDINRSVGDQQAAQNAQRQMWVQQKYVHTLSQALLYKHSYPPITILHDRCVLVSLVCQVNWQIVPNSSFC